MTEARLKLWVVGVAVTIFVFMSYNTLVGIHEANTVAQFVFSGMKKDLAQMDNASSEEAAHVEKGMKTISKDMSKGLDSMMKFNEEFRAETERRRILYAKHNRDIDNIFASAQKTFEKLIDEDAHKPDDALTAEVKRALSNPDHKEYMRLLEQAWKNREAAIECESKHGYLSHKEIYRYEPLSFNAFFPECQKLVVNDKALEKRIRDRPWDKR